MRHLIALLVLIIAVALGSAGCAARVAPAALVPLDENGNLRGSAGPWLFLFDLDNEAVRPSTDQLETTAQEIATYLRAHPNMTLKVDLSLPAGADAQAVRQRRLAAIRDALVKAGVPGDRITLGVPPGPPTKVP